MHCKLLLRVPLVAWALLMSACGTSSPSQPSAQSKAVQEPDEISERGWAPPEDRVALSPSEFSPFLAQAHGAGWELISIDHESVVLKKKKQLLAFKLHWEKVVSESVAVPGTNLASLADTLGLAEEITKAKTENVEGAYRAYDLDVLSQVIVEVHTNHHQASRCSAGSTRLLQLANSTSQDNLYYFLLYDTGDHVDPPGYGPRDIEWLLARQEPHVDLSPIHCVSKMEVSHGRAAGIRLSEIIETQHLKAIKVAPQESTLRFQLPFQETLVVKATTAGDGQITVLRVQTHNHGTHGHTYYKDGQNLATWGARGAVTHLGLEGGDAFLRSAQGTITIAPELLCCLAQEGEDMGSEFCSHQRTYDFGGICGGMHKTDSTH